MVDRIGYHQVLRRLSAGAAIAVAMALAGPASADPPAYIAKPSTTAAAPSLPVPSVDARSASPQPPPPIWELLP